MPANSPYRRSNRNRPRRGAPPTDAVVAALTLQVIACLLLLVAALLTKKADENRYGQIRQQYNTMASQFPQDFPLPAVQGEGVQGLFATMESFITSLVERFSGPGAVPEAPAGEAEPSREEDSGDGLPTSFDYNYLSASEVLYTGTGQGGAWPVAPGARGDSSQPPPQGATYAQVELLGKLIPPITGLITSEFSYRSHPVSGSDDFHNGMDIAAEEGRDILAALPGEVKEVGVSEIYGNYIILQHATHLQTFYAHCSEILAEEGMAVRQGERIAKVGSTGVATGPHLHFSVIVDGQYTDPYWVLRNNIRLVG